ncbi:pyridoxamine 5'-phosphate oxidase family protein [Actinophytocola sp.]|uniref:pyridoxamine 5'-phosphate oxidase family protein n=1 Tax=Actinophytocola sp. TaxID=1872138 RepID=UPI002ED9E75C
MTIATRVRSLGERECWSLLGGSEMGRLCYTEAAMPVVRAVPFEVAGAGIVVALRASTVRAGAFEKPTIVAFEAGEWARGRRRGWSVQVVGRALAVPGHPVTGLSWMDGEATVYVRVNADVLSGERVGPACDARTLPRPRGG